MNRATETTTGAASEAAQATPAQRSEAAKEQVRDAGRGGIALTAAKLYFLVLGLAQQIALSWLLKDGYGALRGALSPASITYNPLIAAGVQGMSRAVSRSRHEGQQTNALRSALVVHFVIAAVTAGVFFVLAPYLGDWLNSHYLVPAFRWLSLAILGYGLYAPLVGVLNGQRRFLMQAALDTVAATVRTIALFVGAWWWLSLGTPAAVEGSSLAFAGITLFMFLLGAVAARPKLDGKSRPGAWEHLAFVGPVIFAQWMLNLLLQADTNTLRGFATRAAERAGEDPQAADALVAAYNAAQLFGFLPYQILMGITFIVFPMLARAHADKDHEAVMRYTRTGLRIALIVTGAIVSVSSGLSANLLRLVFPPSFAETGAESMQLLCIGLGGFALFGMTTTVLNSLGRQWHSMAYTIVALGLVVVFNFLLVRPLAFGEGLLKATAIATSLGILLGLILSVFEVRRTTKTVVAPLTLLRTVVGASVCIGVGRLVPDVSRPLTVLASGAIVVLYFSLLALMREVGKEDMDHVKAIVRRRR